MIAAVTERMFPVLLGQTKRYIDSWGAAAPKEVPWGFLEPHEAQAKRNHDQTLARLAERGGLSPTEMLAIVTGVTDYPATPMVSVCELNQLVAEWKAGQGEVPA